MAPSSSHLPNGRPRIARRRCAECRPQAAGGWRQVLILIAVAGLPGCTAVTHRNDWSSYTGPGAEYFQRPEVQFPFADDPLEPVNRVVWAANEAVWLGVVDPVSTAWRFVVPQPVRDHLVKAAINLGAPGRAVNSLLQARFQEAGDEALRFLVNTTVGIGGLFDPASEWGIGSSREDFGRTLHAWGWHNSSYLALPLLGPSSPRETIGLIGDSALDPATYFFPAGPIKGFILGSEGIDDYKRFLQTNRDGYQMTRLMWVIDRQTRPAPGPTSAQTGPAVDTLSSALLTFREPWFPYRARTRRVTVPATGRKLGYELWLQPHPAPVVFVVPGVGNHRRSRQSLGLAEIAHDHGFSVVAVSNPMNFDFMRTAATAAVPGFPPADADDLHAALDAVSRDLQQRYGERISGRILLGMSLGALHTLHIAAAETEREGLVSFDRYVCLSPPLRLQRAAEQFDGFYNAPLKVPEARRDAWMRRALCKAMAAGLTEEGNPRPGTFEELEAEFLVGVNFRFVLHDAIWVSQQRHDMGVLKTPRSALQRAAASREILEFSYMEYFHAFLAPYYLELENQITSPQQMLDLADATALAGKLPPGKVRVVTNANDFLLTSEDLEWFQDTLGPDNVTVFPSGGHGGNLHLPEVQAAVGACLGME